LLDMGLDPCALNNKHQAPLELAKIQQYDEIQSTLEEYLSRQRLVDLVRNNHLDDVLEAIQKGADVNERSRYGETPLMEASALGYQDITESLIARGADLNAVNDAGQTALDLARENGREAIAQLLEKSLQSKTVS
ncbi:MAG: ankyrin repeat domain-containing protein, partial [Candidatus Omnitrophota bacterium]